MRYGFGVDIGGTTVKIAWFDENGQKHWEYLAGVSEYVKAQRAKEAQAKGQEADAGR